MSDPERILRLYEQGMAGCRSRSVESVTDTVGQLIAALSFEHEAAALVVFRLYEHCGRQARLGHFEASLRVFGELRDAWTRSRPRGGASPKG